MDTEDIKIRFTYHKPDEEKSCHYKNIRDFARELADLINKICPDSREKSLAITNLEQCVMWANASIARETTK